MSPMPARFAMCAECGAEFKLRRSERRFCSWACAKKWKRGPNNHFWKGGRSVRSDGYVVLALGQGDGHHEHVAVAERATGKRLPVGAEVHHFNENRSDNRHRNLVICQDRAYHMLLHTLRRVQVAGGRPFLDRVCSYCHLPKPAGEYSGPASHRCRPCGAAYLKARAS